MRWQWRQEQSNTAAIRFNANHKSNQEEDMPTSSPPAKRKQFFLKIATPPGEADSPYADLYLRHHGSGINSVVLTASPPRFIKAHTEDSNETDKGKVDGRRILFTSNSHEGRQWGLVLCRDGEKLAGWERVEIVEDGGSTGFDFRDREDGSGEDLGVLESSMQDDEGERVWRGWCVCEWSTGHPQLFWVTHKLKGPLPEFFARVDVVREMMR